MSVKNFPQINPIILKQWLHDGDEIALLDVREAGQFGEEHLLLANPLPYSRLEIDVSRLVPRKNTRIVLVDESGTDVAPKAAASLHALGYTDVRLLEGGMDGWKAAGFECFAGVNVPSKVFGELAEAHFDTPHIAATELARWQEEGKPVVILDGRPLAEFNKMSIPGAKCCPNGELALRIDDLVEDDETPVVINCAGCTRSIIGAQTLINLGLTNPVYALENGTQGWYLQDLVLDHGKTAHYGDVKDKEVLATRAQRAETLLKRFDIPVIDAQTLADWWQQGDRTTYLCDVRTPDEATARPIAGAQSAPGGQLVQATDQYVATRGARVVLVDGDDVRAPAMATWLHMLGWDVSVLASDELPKWKTWHDKHGADVVKASQETLPLVKPTKWPTLRDQGAYLLDVRPSMAYREGHVEDAVWSIRPILEDKLRSLKTQPEHVVLVSDDVAVAALAAQNLKALGIDRVSRLDGDVEAWRKAGLSVVATPNEPDDAACIDYLFFVHDRHDGNKEAARQYLAWETGLIAQLDAQEKALFRLPEVESGAE